MSAERIPSVVGCAEANGGFGPSDRRPALLALPALAAACLAGPLFAIAYSQEPIWWAAWLAPAFGLTAVLLAPRRWRFWIGLFVGLAGGATSLGYYAVTAASWPVAIGLVTGRALLWTWMFNLAARAAERWRPQLAIFVLPLLLTAAETLITRLSPHGAAGSLAYSQMEFLTLLQVASFAGIAGINFILCLGASTIALATAHVVGWRGRAGLRSAIIIGTVVVLAALALAHARLAAAPKETNGQEVALIAQDRLGKDRGDVERFWRVYGPQLRSAAQPGRIVILPEAILVLPRGAAYALANQLASLARSRSTTIVAGFVVEHDGLATNRALIAQPDGSLIWYHKQHLVPVLEQAISPGRMPVLVDLPGARTGIAICKDMHFPSLGRDYALRGAKLMLVPAADFIVDGWMASRMTAFRGVEGGFAVARTARTGLLTVSDRYGRVLAEQASGSRVTTMIARLPSIEAAEPTIFVRFGQVIGLLSIAVATGLLVMLRKK